ncbi:endolytic transglycosylase MltG [Ornithinimicrobium sp. W1665]|uniref:endolytic transglycosylase MltG n=1 Tax=Ornithinimicrobium sp. W1665 TaxID=3416666 RepID=UPI003CEA5DAC
MSHPPHEDWDEHDVHGTASGTRFDDDVLGLRGVHDHDESLADDVLEPEEQLFRRRRRRRRNPVLVGISLLLAGALVVTASVFAVGWMRDLLPDVSIGEPTAQDYEGSGTGEVMVEVPPGAGGGEIAQLLVENDVVASAGAFTAALQADPRSSSIQPGTYRMAGQMSSQAALGRLLDGNFREIDGVTVREGLWVAETFAALAEATGHEVADYEAVDPASLDLPDAAEGELEGFLYPSTYEFGPDTTPEEQLQTLVDQGRQVYADLGIADDELREVIIKASIVQGEGMFSEDLPKVARVVENRLQPNPETNGYLQMDSTVHFIFQERGLAGTTDEQRADDDPHNTYAYPGLPAGPINSPGEEAIRAVLEPEPGDWLYFVTVDPSTGETRFATDWAGHQENVQLFQQWCQDNPDQC